MRLLKPSSPVHTELFSQNIGTELYRSVHRKYTEYSTVCAVSGNRSVYRMATHVCTTVSCTRNRGQVPSHRIYETTLHRSVLWTTSSVTVIMLVSKVQWAWRNINYKGRPCKRLRGVKLRNTRTVAVSEQESQNTAVHLCYSDRHCTIWRASVTTVWTAFFKLNPWETSTDNTHVWKCGSFKMRQFAKYSFPNRNSVSCNLWNIMKHRLLSWNSVTLEPFNSVCYRVKQQS